MSRFQHCLRDVRSANRTVSRDLRDAFPRNRHAQPLKVLHHTPCASNPVIAERGKRRLKFSVLRVKEVAEDMRLALRHVRRDLDAGDESEAGVLRRRLPRLFQPLCGIVVSQSKIRDAGRGGLIHEFGGRQDTVRDRGVGV